MADEAGGEADAVTLVLGGTRSGKSAVAERLVTRGAGSGTVTYVATAVGEPGDAAWRARIDAHRARRPLGWRTVELERGGDLAGLLGALDGPVLVDSLGVWVAGFGDMVAPATPLCEVLVERGRRGAPTVLVSEEVGLGVHPVTSAGRTFADALGMVNQAVAAVADRTVLVVAGRTLLLDGGR